jgi:hypothetical protein
MKDLELTRLLETDPNSESAEILRAKLTQMGKPIVVDKKTFRTTEVARILTSLFMIGVGFAVEFYFPNSKIVGDWSTGGSIIAAGTGILAMVFILLFANKGLDIYERFVSIKTKGETSKTEGEVTNGID